MTASTAPLLSRLRGATGRFAVVLVRPRTYRSLAYLAMAVPLGVLYLAGLAAGLSLGFGLLMTPVGLLLVVATLAAATVVAGFEAILARRLLGTEVPLPEALCGAGSGGLLAAPGDGFLAGVGRLLVAPTTWTSVVLLVLKVGFGVVVLVALVASGSLAVATLGAPLLYDAPNATYRFGSLVVDTLPEALLVAAAGLVLTLAALHLLCGLARLGGLLTAALLDVGSRDAGAGESASATPG